MNQPSIALPQDLAVERARKAQNQQEIHAVMFTMTCSLYERLVTGMVTDVEKAVANEHLPEYMHHCAKIARLASRVALHAIMMERGLPRREHFSGTIRAGRPEWKRTPSNSSTGLSAWA